jgi:hypothetical protein
MIVPCKGCQGILIEPVCCSECQAKYCKTCWNLHTGCSQSSMDCNLETMIALKGIKLWCTACSFKKSFLYDEFLQHRLKCPDLQVICPFKCSDDKTILRKDLFEHLQ